MNCSLPVDVLSSLLWFLTSQLPNRSFILHSEAPEAAAIGKAMMKYGRFLVSLQGSIGTSRGTQPSHTMFIRVYLGKHIHEKIVTGFGSISLFVTNDCVQDPHQFPDNSEKVLVADLGGRSCCHLRQILPTLPGTPPDSRQVAVFDSQQQRWLLNDWPLEKSPLSTPLPSAVLKVAITTSAKLTEKQVVRRFNNSLANIYWTILVDHFKFRLDLDVVSLRSDHKGSESFLNTVAEFSRGRHDVIGDLMLINPERAETLTFMLVGLEVKFHFIIRRPEYEFSWVALLYPLSEVTWYSILVMVGVVGLALKMIVTRAPDSRQDISSSFFTAYGFCCCQANLGRLKNLSLQIACVASLLCFYAVNQFYVSNLYSILSTRKIHYPFNSIEEFVEKETHRLIINPETSSYNAFQFAEEGVLLAIWEKFLRDDPHHVVIGSNGTAALERLCDGSSAVFALPLQILPHGSASCPLQAVPAGYFPTPMGLATNKHFPYLRHFRALFLRATEAGVSNWIKGKYVTSQMTPLKKTDASKDPLPVSFYQLLLLFLMFGVAIVISLVVLMLEIIYFRRMRSISRA